MSNTGYDPDSLRDAIALLTVAVDGDATKGRELLRDVLAERPSEEIVVALVAVGSAMAFRMAQLGVIAFNCDDTEMKAQAEAMAVEELRPVALESLQALGSDLAGLLGPN